MVLLITELLKDWPCTAVGEDLGIFVSGITEHSANVKQGYIFVVRKGASVDGACYIKEAIDGGAVAIVMDRSLVHFQTNGIPIITVPDCRRFLAYACARFAGNPSEQLTVIAVTGTNGKTTVTHFVGQILSRFGVRSAVIGTTGIFVDGKKIDFEAPDMTTLPAEYFQPLLRKCLEEGVTHIVLEASSLGLSTGRLDYCDIDIGVLLNIGIDHIDEHGGTSNYIRAKKKLVDMSKVFIANRDDEVCVKMTDSIANRCIYFGTHSLSDVRILREENLYLMVRNEKQEFPLSVPGNFNELNSAAAISVLLELGFQIKEIMKHVGALMLPEGRLQSYEQDGITVYVDFAHTPDAIEAVLRSLLGICEGKLITVFGCGGNRDKGKRAKMGAIAALYSSQVIVTSDNPRSEDPHLIIKDIIQGFRDDFKGVQVEPDRKRAIQMAIALASEGDIVLIAGKGHEKTQQTAEGVFLFSDQEEAKKALFSKQVNRGRNLLSNQFTDVN
ncbi:UDP-N-acetylmuramoyl-L-alanyl-D-glutamate--2,6-diaminopimelate ligase [Sporosarcina siberiensis]|uniref:UDP-N-acetylmuramoyl-L-alanyl-D-glutamate--2,6-diaminopimelate ligase n=1 Tax=Sporosarcina siberiensis TaxID=1365606 RepID=A0ABW4SIL5_9BACL